MALNNRSIKQPGDTKQKNLYTVEICAKVLDSLEKVSTEAMQLVCEVAENTPLSEIIQTFNQYANDLFQIILDLIKKYNLNDKSFKISGYRNLFNNAISANVRLPIDKFTLTILSYASEIYNQNDKMFMDMKVEPTKIKVGNEFEIFSSDVFKQAWKMINDTDKTNVRDIIMNLTMYSHAYFCVIIKKMTCTA